MTATLSKTPSWTEQTHPQAVIAWALASFDKLVMTSGFNLNGIVLIDMAVKAGYRGDVLFVDTGYHFKETLDTRDSLSARYPELNFITLSAKRPDDQMYAYDTDRCCALRKVAPLENFLEDLQPDAILSARSREQTESRKHLPFVDSSAARATVNPLIHWTQEMLEAYAKEHELAVNPLYWEGFLSIGCWPCTRAVRPGEDARAGRWAGLGKTECGLWTDQGSQAV